MEPPLLFPNSVSIKDPLVWRGKKTRTDSPALRSKSCSIGTPNSRTEQGRTPPTAALNCIRIPSDVRRWLRPIHTQLNFWVSPYSDTSRSWSSNRQDGRSLIIRSSGPASRNSTSLFSDLLLIICSQTLGEVWIYEHKRQHEPLAFC
jgi:hypothetical protein